MEHIEQKKNTEEELKASEWLDIENYLRVLAPDLYRKYQLQNNPRYQGTKDIESELLEIRKFSIHMVRYAIEPSDSAAILLNDNKTLINPDTKKPFTIEDTGISREKCIGPTSGIEGREKQIAEITIAMYKKIHQHKKDSGE